MLHPKNNLSSDIPEDFDAICLKLTLKALFVTDLVMAIFVTNVLIHNIFSTGNKERNEFMLPFPITHLKFIAVEISFAWHLVVFSDPENRRDPN